MRVVKSAVGTITSVHVTYVNAYIWLSAVAALYKNIYIAIVAEYSSFVTFLSCRTHPRFHCVNATHTHLQKLTGIVRFDSISKTISKVFS